MLHRKCMRCPHVWAQRAFLIRFPAHVSLQRSVGPYSSFSGLGCGGYVHRWKLGCPTQVSASRAAMMQTSSSSTNFVPSRSSNANFFGNYGDIWCDDLCICFRVRSMQYNVSRCARSLLCNFLFTCRFTSWRVSRVGPLHCINKYERDLHNTLVPSLFATLPSTTILLLLLLPLCVRDDDECETHAIRSSHPPQPPWRCSLIDSCPLLWTGPRR